ncbi:DotU family type IV/VI secretion system protein [Fundidesulfovibrio terrae]|uniref:DotU family type IV/VI secretion system protein n=1 Tax=Fundidesulfovibrio terrae TaxID=2922866 RepID=UPI001FAFC075
MRLVDCFVPAVTYVLDVVRKPASFSDYDASRAKVEELLNSAGRSAKTLGVAASEFQDARFAVCAWMDEMVLGSAWEGKARWLHQPLQRTVYGTVNAGEEYFDRLDALLAKSGGDFEFSAPGEKASVDELSFGPDEPEPHGPACAPGSPGPQKESPFAAPHAEGDVGLGVKGVLEVFGLTMMLGFTGRYFHPDDQAALGSLRQKTIATALASPASLAPGQASRLFPGLYGPESGTAGGRRRFWRGMDWADMVVIGLPLLAVAVMFLAYSTILSGALKGFMGGP